MRFDFACAKLLARMAACAVIVSGCVSAADEARLEQFGRSLDSLRQQYRIPGLSAAIVKNGRNVWEQGFGFADVQNRIPAQPDTPYLIASLTKTFTSMLLMSCVEQGSLNLDDPIRKYSSAIPDAGVTVRHVFTHTSERKPPGQAYLYNGARFATLGPVADSCAGTPYRLLLTNSILDGLGLVDTMPGKDTGNPPPSLAAFFNRDALVRYAGILQRLAKPYKIDARGQPLLAAYPQEGLDAAAGIISTVRDLARYDAAIDSHALLQPSTQEQAWTNPVNSRGQVLPYALGWFVQRYAGLRLVWHYGYWDTFSALIVKAPERHLTLLLLANSDGLSAPFPNLGGAGDVTASPFATAFLAMLQEPGVLAATSPALTSNGVVNSADQSTVISPSSWVTIYGQNLAPLGSAGRGWREDEITNGIFPTSLDGISVRVDGRPAALSYVSAEQINLQAPDNISTGSVAVEVIGPAGSSTAKVPAQAIAPALFVGPAGRVLAFHPDGSLVGTPELFQGATPARPDEVIAFYGTGFGLTSPLQPSGRSVEPSPLASGWAVTIGTVGAQVDYAGLVAPGLYQFNVRVPLGSSGNPSIRIEVGGFSTQRGLSIPVR